MTIEPFVVTGYQLLYLNYPCAVQVTVRKIDWEGESKIEYIRILRDARDLTAVRREYPGFPSIEFENDTVIHRADNDYLYTAQLIGVV